LAVVVGGPKSNPGDALVPQKPQPIPTPTVTVFVTPTPSPTN
jgi:rod shape-determining protein MreC